MPVRSAGARALRSRSRSVSPAVSPQQDLELGQTFSCGVSLAFLAFLLLMSACSGGGEKSTANANFRCTSGATDVLCLQSCNLGCSATGCSRTEVAQNELIVLTFSEDVDPSTVSSSSIVFRTPTGSEAVGEFLVSGNRVEFVPALATSGGQTFYGFTNGETYLMTIVGTDNVPAVVRGTSGRPFGQTLSCTLESRRGIIDYDEAPPSARLVSPIRSNNVPLDTIIELEFSELIDPTPFISSSQSPVKFFVRSGVVDQSGVLVCDPNADRLVLAGSQFPTFDAARGVTVLSFLPAGALPANACIEIEVGAQIVDLSGRAAIPETFTFSTRLVPLEEGRVVEDFMTADQLDRNQSAATWGGGEALFARIGGDGRHGRFDPALLVTATVEAGVPVYTIDCDNTTIPAESTATGASIAVTDGQFSFTEFVVPDGVVVRFVGSSPPIVTACGRIEVVGEIDIAGQSQTDLPTQGLGQPGGQGGVFAGSGGTGGDQCSGLGTGGGAFSGRDGQDARLVAGHAYVTSRVGTGGRGSQLFPASGMTSQRLQHPNATGVVNCLNAVAGGGGGSSLQAGEVGAVQSTTSPDPITNVAPWLATFGPQTLATSQVQLLPYPGAGSSLQSSRHFLVGGGGGGGAASNTTLSFLAVASGPWVPGGGGGGGGGALALRAGSRLRVSENGRVSAFGGSTPDLTYTFGGVRAIPGGGGAGGSVVMQCAGEVELFGALDVRGGAGGLWDRTYSTPPNGAAFVVKAGSGAPGLVRMEAPGASVGGLDAVVLPNEASKSAVELEEQDSRVACQSLFYSTELTLPPQYLRYEITAVVDGVTVLFSDDPQLGTMVAGPGSPLRAVFQAATIDLSTGVVSEIKPWRPTVGSTPNQPSIASDPGNAFRYRLVVDHMFATTVIVQRVEVIYQS